jgi:hypothetical protein
VNLVSLCATPIATAGFNVSRQPVRTSLSGPYARFGYRGDWNAVYVPRPICLHFSHRRQKFRTDVAGCIAFAQGLFTQLSH